MSFFLGFGDELVKVGFGASLAQKGGEAAGRGAVMEADKKYGKSIMGAGLGALVGKAFLGKGALGALGGLGVVHREKLLAAAKKAKEKAEEAVRSKK